MHNADTLDILAETGIKALSTSLVVISRYSDTSPFSTKCFGIPANVVHAGAK